MIITLILPKSMDIINILETKTARLLKMFYKNSTQIDKLPTFFKKETARLLKTSYKIPLPEFPCLRTDKTKYSRHYTVSIIKI
jgi:hypothetical protein